MYICCATMTTKILRTHFAKLNSVPRQQEFLVLPLNSWQAPTLNLTTLGTHVGSMEFVLFSDWLTSLGVMSSKLIHVVACVRIPATLRSVLFIHVHFVYPCHAAINRFLGAYTFLLDPKRPCFPFCWVYIQE